jgi:manganese/zinc/iron transport system substrate-binding protein
MNARASIPRQNAAKIGRRSALSLALCIFVLISQIIGTYPANAQSDADRKINVVATIGMIGDVVKVVGGDRINLTTLMGPGVDPHLYRATANDVTTLQKADIIFRGGLNLEGKMGEIFSKLANKIPVYAMGDGIPEDELLEFPGYADQYDPHIWFDVSYWSRGVGTVADGLAKLDPKNADAYQKRAKEYQETLALVDQYTKDAIATIPKEQRLMITAHDAFSYFARRYDIEVQGLQGVSTEAEAGVEDVRKLADLIVSRKVPAIFIETSVPARTIEAVQAAVKARGWNVAIGVPLFSDALGDEGTLEGTYIGMVLHNDAAIVTALGGKLPPLPEALKEYLPVLERATFKPAQN